MGRATDRQKIIDRIQMIMRLADTQHTNSELDGQNRDGEIELATQKIAELIDRYKVTDDELRAAHGEAKSAAEMGSRLYYVPNKMAAGAQRRTALCAILRSFGAAVCYRDDIGQPHGSLMGFHITAFAEERTLALIDSIIPILLLNMEGRFRRENKQRRAEMYALGYDSRSVRAPLNHWNRSWWLGFGNQLSARITATRKTVINEHQTSGTGAELVLKSEHERATEYMNDMEKGLRTVKNRLTVKDFFGYDSGATAANDAELGTDRVTKDGEKRLAIGS